MNDETIATAIVGVLAVGWIWGFAYQLGGGAELAARAARWLCSRFGSSSTAGDAAATGFSIIAKATMFVAGPLVQLGWVTYTLTRKAATNGLEIGGRILHGFVGVGAAFLAVGRSLFRRRRPVVAACDAAPVKVADLPTAHIHKERSRCPTNGS